MSLAYDISDLMRRTGYFPCDEYLLRDMFVDTRFKWEYNNKERYFKIQTDTNHELFFHFDAYGKIKKIEALHQDLLS